MVLEEGEDFLECHLVDDGADPCGFLENEELRRALVQAIEALPEREKLMMALYYEQDLNLREIGEVMGVTESRVCQLHGQAVMRLRARIVGGGGRKTSKATRHG
jgi:RNA polymerase sigma factor for flagellar operon FliA